MAVCAEQDCALAVTAQGYCKRHYYARRRSGLLVRVLASNDGCCSIVGCERNAHKKTLCASHYKKQWRTGRPEGHGKAMRGEAEKWLRANVGHTGQECLMWPFARSGAGYGGLAIGGYEAPASRHMAILLFGPLDRKTQVCHRCDNPGCINPNHLFLGTAMDNHKDCVSKGRHVNPPRMSGEQNAEAKITADQVRWAKGVLRAGQMTGKAVAQQLGISQSQASRLKHDLSWVGVK